MPSTRRSVLSQPPPSTTTPRHVVSPARSTVTLRRRRRRPQRVAAAADAADASVDAHGTAIVPQQHVERGVARIVATLPPPPPLQQAQQHEQARAHTRQRDADDLARLFAPRPPPRPPVTATPRHMASSPTPSTTTRAADDDACNSNDSDDGDALPLPAGSLLADVLDVSSPSATTTTTTTTTMTGSITTTRARRGDTRRKVDDATSATTTHSKRQRCACHHAHHQQQHNKATCSSCSSCCCHRDVADRAAATRRRIAQLLTAAHTPPALHRALLETIYFFTHVRVYMVLLLVLALLLYTMHRGGVLDDVASTFVVADDNRPGLSFWARYQHGNRTFPRQHPVLLIPGFITAALELWGSELPCLREQAMLTSPFRQHMFGPQMLFLILRHPQCWLDLFSLDRVTGLDRAGVRVRADSGFASVDFFVPGYWVWAKVLVNLADIGYDPQSMAVITHDWRLSPRKMHERDGVFYHIRHTLQFLTQKNRERAIVVSHSYGANVALAFFRWAEQHERGFMDRHVAYYVNIGGTVLGLPKSVSAVLLGDVRDTIAIPRAARTALDTFIRQSARYNLTRTWTSLLAMLPRGCAAASPELLRLGNGTTLDVARVLALLQAECARTGHVACERAVAAHRAHAANTLPSLPRAPHTTVVCLYGVNKPAETGYVLEHTPPPVVATTTTAATDGVSPSSSSSSAWPYGVDLLTNTSYSDEETVRGVRLSDGDGTVPLLSLGYMCRAPNGWRRNVGRVVTVEYRHDERAMSPLNLRGSSVSGDHVDILGNFDLIDTILKLASGVSELDGDDDDDDNDDTAPHTNNDDDDNADDERDGEGVTPHDGDDDDTDAARRRRRRVVSRRNASVSSAAARRARAPSRRVRDRIYSDIDRLIHTHAASCLQQPHDYPDDDEDDAGNNVDKATTPP